MLTEIGLSADRKHAEGMPMNDELMRDENFIRCSTMVAELLMKYRDMENEDSGESVAGSPPYFFVLLGLISALSSFIIWIRRCLLLTNRFAWYSAYRKGDIYSG